MGLSFSETSTHQIYMRLCRYVTYIHPCKRVNIKLPFFETCSIIVTFDHVQRGFNYRVGSRVAKCQVGVIYTFFLPSLYMVIVCSFSSRSCQASVMFTAANGRSSGTRGIPFDDQILLSILEDREVLLDGRYCTLFITIAVRRYQ